MILDMTQQLAGLDGKAMMEGETPIMLRTVCVNALMATLPKDNENTGDKKLAIFTIAQKITQEDKPDLDIKDVDLIRDRVGKAFGPAIVGPAFPILNGTPCVLKLADGGKDKKDK